MKIPSQSIFALVIGLGLGWLISRSASESGPEKGASGEGGSENSSAIPRRSDGRGSEGSKKARKVAQGRASGRLGSLLDLTSNNHGTPPTREFYEALDGLDQAGIASILADIGDGASNDVRIYKLRTALFDRWAKIDPEGAWAAAAQIGNAQIRGQAIGSVMGEIARSDFVQAQIMLSGIDDPKIKQAALYAIISNAAADHPEEVFQLLSGNTLKGRQSHQFHSLFSNWAREDPSTAIAKLKEIKNIQDRQQASNAVASALAAEDPQRAIDFAMGLGTANERNNALNMVASQLTGNDPQEAIRLLEGVTDGAARARILAGISSTWLRNDADAAMVWIESLPPAEKGKAIEQGMWQLINSDVEKAAELLGSMNPGNRTSHYFSNLASQWAQQDPQAALKWVENLPVGSTRTQAMSGMIGALAQNDPQMAATFLEKEGINQNTSNQIGGIVASWVQTDRVAALEWMNGLDLKGDVQSIAISNVVSNWAGHDATAAAEFVLSLESGKARDQGVNSLFNSWASNSPVEARDWLDANLQGEERNKALGSLIQTISHNDYSTALKMYEEAAASLPAETMAKHFGNVTSRIVGSWSQHDPQGASTWLMSQPESDQRTSSVTRMVDNWGNYDIDGAAKFVLTLGEGKERDEAVGRLVSDVRGSDPEAAFLWADSIGDESSRKRAIRQSVEQWKDDDPVAARAAVASANLSQEVKGNILKELGD